NRVSPWLDIDSYLPYEGRVVIHDKKAKRISVRIPAWVKRDAIRLNVNDQERRFDWAGNFALVADLTSCDTLIFTFPMVERVLEQTVPLDKKYTIIFRGNTVVDIQPRDNIAVSYPIYLRDGYKASEAPMKTVTRFVADKTLIW